MGKTILSAMTLFCLSGIYAQNAASVFIDMPRNKIMLLADVDRRQMIDRFTNGAQASVTNAFYGDTELVQLTDDYLKLQLTEQNSLEIKLLPVENDAKIICIVNTACAPVCDSRIKFYTLEWEAIEAQILMPKFGFETFLNDKDAANEARQNALTTLDTSFFKYELGVENPTLTIHYTTPGFLGKEERKELEPYLTHLPVVLYWTPDGFR